MKTLHRKDMTATDFDRLARFSSAIKKVRGVWGLLAMDLGVVPMRVPVWTRSCGDWKLSGFKTLKQEALGFAASDFRRLCKYLDVKESEMIHTLFRFSILAVVPGQARYEKLQFRQPFTGEELEATSPGLPHAEIGFVMERRRIEGHFR